MADPTTMMKLVIQVLKEEADAITKKMMKIITREVKEENPRKTIPNHGDNLKKIPKKRQRMAKEKRPKKRRRTTMTTRRGAVTMVTKNLTGREMEEITTSQESLRKKTTSKD